MFWLATATTAALLSVIALVVVMLARRRPDTNSLGSVSTSWITSHRDV